MLHTFSKLHVIPLRVFQLLKSERWNSTVFGVLHSPVATELRAELVDVWTVVGRRERIVSNGPPVARRGGACC